MRKVVSSPAHLGALRIVERFILIPKTLPIYETDRWERRWWETYRVVQEYQRMDETSAHWVTIAWAKAT